MYHSLQQAYEKKTAISSIIQLSYTMQTFTH